MLDLCDHVQHRVFKCTGLEVSLWLASGSNLIQSAVFQRSIMMEPELQSELTRLIGDQDKARNDQVFGGLSPAERAEYDRKAERIHDLESVLCQQKFHLRK
ncbi:MAG: hypothetical protein JWQ87_4602 [Candidatus Sulfotelmatobacter sp.]|nr:hypothetical protein [Candidatus Sulfotelmatobacter sp.]